MRNIVLVWLLARFNSGRAITSAKVYNEIEQEGGRKRDKNA